MDNFYEQLNKAGKSPVYGIMQFLSYVFFAFSLVFLISLNPLLLAVSLLLGLILFFVKKKYFVEYEYGYTNSEIYIDMITEQKNRKRIIAFNIKDIQAYGDESLADVARYKNMGKIINAISTNDKSKVYGLYAIIENRKYYIRFTPDKKFYDLINRFNRRAEIK
jgi:hypothetical protein